MVREVDGQSYITHYGYRIIYVDGTEKLEHVAVAEKALGKPMPRGAVVHHVNEEKLDNRTCNLVICPNRKYHNLLHRRMDALRECGHADWHRCEYCKKHDPEESMCFRKNGRYGYFHAACARSYNNHRYASRKNIHVA